MRHLRIFPRRKGHLFYAAAVLLCLLAIAVVVHVRLYLPLAKSMLCLHSSDQLDCIEGVLEQETVSRGIDAAYATFNDIYALDPSFSSDCHFASHAIGQGAYQLYAKGVPIRPLGELSSCGYGFYHGFMISLLAATGDVKEARAFCDAQASQSGGDRGIMAGCLHGFGHGITELDQVQDWSKPLSVIAPELALCERIGTNDSERSLCAGGVFNSLGEEYLVKRNVNPKWSGIIDPEKPYALCEEESYVPFRDACFRDLNSVLARLYQDNLAPAFEKIGEIPDSANASLAMSNYTDFEARLFGNDSTKMQSAGAACYGAPEGLIGPCIVGFVDGIMEFSTPGAEYVDALKFCEGPEIQSTDSAACFTEVVRGSRKYPQKTFNAMCASMPAAYRSLCALPQRG